MTTSVNIERVKQLEVLGGEYCDRFPPSHWVIITPEDSIPRKIPLKGYKIDILIKGIAKERLINPWEEGKWDSFKGDLDYFHFCTGKDAFPTFEEVLSDIFDRFKNETPVHASMVKLFKIDSECNNLCPCSHDVEISLEDGRCAKTGMEDFEIAAMLKAISKNKVETTTRFEHFDNLGEPLELDSGKTIEPLEFHTGRSAFPIADEFLTEIFNANEFDHNHRRVRR